jgi:hypothetical protein
MPHLPPAHPTKQDKRKTKTKLPGFEFKPCQVNDSSHKPSNGPLGFSVTEDHKAQVAYDFFSEILGVPADRANLINIYHLELPQLDLSNFGERFTEEEVMAVTRALPPDKASGPGSFTGRFLQSA